MKQHKEIKDKYPDALLLFSVGDFYIRFLKPAFFNIGISKIPHFRADPADASPAVDQERLRAGSAAVHGAVLAG